ncbi:MAG: hypothetical protein CMA80_00915 [Euryarchaeota archaeon]|nr:hypothetical protein [Euryarchaeota archaeon]
MRGILIGFVLVVAYCYAGGIRASIWTDAAQSCVMIVGSSILCYVAVSEVGGFSGLHNSLKDIDPGMVNLFPADLTFGVTLWIGAFFLGGLGVAGQPQVVSRVMTLKDDKDRKEAAIWFFVWQTPFIALMFIIGLACRAIFLDLDASQAQDGLPLLAMEVLNPFLAGVILASIFAATMSTADSQVLACTAAITDDVRPEWSTDHKTTKVVTLVVAIFATAIALVGQEFPGFGDSVFALVVLAVYGLGGIFVPLLLIRMMGYEPDTEHTVWMMTAALSAVIVWSVSGYGDDIFPSIPAMSAAFATHFILCWRRSESDQNPLGRYSLPTQQTAAVGAVVILVLFGALETTYVMMAPESSEATDDRPYQLTYTVSEWTQSETLNLNDGETQTFQVTIDNTTTAVLSAVLTIAYTDTGETVTAACDDIVTSPDYSGLAGPFSESDDAERSTNACGSITEVGSITPNAALSEYATGPGDYTLNGTEDELVSVLTMLGKSPEMVGNLNMDVSLNANNGNFLGGDSTESVEVTLTMLIFQPSGLTPTG